MFRRLTALHRYGRRLQPQHSDVRLRDGDPEHHPHLRVLPPDVRLAFLQLDVGVPKLQDAGAVDAVGQGTRRRTRALPATLKGLLLSF